MNTNWILHNPALYSDAATGCKLVPSPGVAPFDLRRAKTCW